MFAGPEQRCRNVTLLVKFEDMLGLSRHHRDPGESFRINEMALSKFSDFDKFPKTNIFRYCVDLQNHTISRKLHQAVKCNHLEFSCSCTHVLYTVARVLADGDAVCLS